MMKKNRAFFWGVGELIVADLIWGFSFVAAKFALAEFGFLTLSALRFLVAGLLSLLFMLLFPGPRALLRFSDIKLSFLPGIFLGLTVLFQTWGLQTTSATKSAFITCLYVLFVPLIERFFLHKKLSKKLYLLIACGILGTAMITDFQGGEVGLGDVFSFICALTSSLHIAWFGFNQKKIGNAFSFNSFQALWAALIPALLAPFFEASPIMPVSPQAIIGFFALTFGASMFAFALQVRAQKVISPSTASLLFLLESPFAGFFSFWLLDEQLSANQTLGALLILIAAMGASVIGQPRKSRSH